MGHEDSSKNRRTTKIQFKTLFDDFIKYVDLCEKEPKYVDPTNTALQSLTTSPDTQKERQLIADLHTRLLHEARLLPGLYREHYAAPLLRNLTSVQAYSPGTLATLTGAIRDHGIDHFRAPLHGLLAFTSNIYRSFLEPERLSSVDFPMPASTIPAVATFNPDPDIDLHFVPFTLPVTEVQRLCGAKVALVSMPSCYRDHAVLTWGCVAHEAGGHDVLHAYPGLLHELRRGVRQLFYQGDDPHTGRVESESQGLGLLWQYWTEETASDVYAVMNLGPMYGLGLALYFAALWERVRRHHRNVEHDGFAALTVSNLYVPWREIIDYHPPNILALYAVIGAIEALRSLSEAQKTFYIKSIKDCIGICLKENTQLIRQYDDDAVAHYQPDAVTIRGLLQMKSGSWVRMEHKGLRFRRDVMQEHARRVGYYIATARLQAFNGHSIQDLETWDYHDEAKAQEIMGKSTAKKTGIVVADQKLDAEFAELGDDAQHFAGALLALFNEPDQYTRIQERLTHAAQASFLSDDVWGIPNWHPIADERSQGGPPRDAISKK
jgi:hypothetical protein